MDDIQRAEAALALTADSRISESAMKLVRYNFNPSKRGKVDDIKMAAAALITLLEPIQKDRNHPGAREAAIAITHTQTASMFGVAAATADL